MPWLHSLELGVLRLEHLGAGLGVLPVVEAVAVGELVVRRSTPRSARPSARCSTGRTASSSGRSSTRRGTGRRRTSASPGGVASTFGSYGAARLPLRQRSMLGRCGTGASLAASAWMPRMKPGRVTRSSIVFGSWQSTQLDRVRAARRARSSCVSPAAPGSSSRSSTTSACACWRTASLPSAIEAVASTSPVAEPAVGRDDRGVAVQARAGLRALGDALGLLLVQQHVGVAAAVAVVDGEGVAGEHARQPRDRSRPSRRGIGASPPPYLVRRRLDRALVAVVLARPVLAPRPRDRWSSSVTLDELQDTGSSPPACAGRC